jgi:hypothetical protein
MKEALHYVSLGLTVCSLIGAVYQYNKDSERPVRLEPTLLKIDTLPKYNIKIYAVPEDAQFGTPPRLNVYMERNLRELPLKFLKNYTACAFSTIQDSVLTIGAKASVSATKVDTFHVILPDSFPKKVTLDMMHKFHQLETE